MLYTYSLKKEENPATTWMNPEDIMLSETRQDTLKDNTA